jgi:hypothetical protein
LVSYTKEERRLRISENKALRRISGPKREEVAGGCRTQNEKLNNLYASQNIVRVIKHRRKTRTGHVARMAEMRNAYKMLV